MQPVNKSPVWDRHSKSHPLISDLLVDTPPKRDLEYSLLLHLCLFTPPEVRAYNTSSSVVDLANNIREQFHDKEIHRSRPIKKCNFPRIWIQNAKRWPPRMPVHSAVRLKGKISLQLTYGGSTAGTITRSVEFLSRSTDCPFSTSYWKTFTSAEHCRVLNLEIWKSGCSNAVCTVIQKSPKSS